MAKIVSDQLETIKNPNLLKKDSLYQLTTRPNQDFLTRKFEESQRLKQQERKKDGLYLKKEWKG